jgi:hypothetical protein
MTEKQWFLVGDFISNIFIGLFAAWLCAVWFDIGDNMFLAMLLGMFVPMLLSMPVALVFGRYFGAIEVMLPMMLTAMIAGMIVSMRATMGEVMAFDIVVYGLLSALLVLMWVGMLNVRLVADIFSEVDDGNN